MTQSRAQSGGGQESERGEVRLVACRRVHGGMVLVHPQTFDEAWERGITEEEACSALYWASRCLGNSVPGSVPDRAESKLRSAFPEATAYQEAANLSEVS